MSSASRGEIFEGKYRLLDVLGEGGFATVYHGRDDVAQRDVAIKILRPVTEDPPPYDYPPETVARFRREVLVLSRLRDPHTVTLFEYGESAAGALYLVFEYVPGRDLSAILDEVDRLPPDVVEHILRQLLEVLHEAHDQGLFHRDIKPANIRVFEYRGDPWQVKLLDFGIAKPAFSDQASSITKSGSLVGTPRYMSPEQLTEKPLTPSSDLYSLGLVAFEMLMGRQALPGGRWSDQLDRLHSGYVLSIPDVDRVGARLAAIVSKMSARKPKDRYPSATTVLRALDAGQVQDRPAPATRAAPIDGVSPDTRRRLWLGLGLTVAVALVLAAVSVSGGDGEEQMKTPSDPPPRRSTPGFVRQDKHEEVPEPPRAKNGSSETITAPTGCGAQPPFTGLKERSQIEGLTRRSWSTYVPTSYSPQRRYPVVMLFHQDGKSGSAIVAQTKFDELAEAKGFIIVAPDDPGFASWRDSSVNYSVLATLEQTRRELCVDESRIFVVGHGVGAIEASRLSCLPGIRAMATNSYRPASPKFACKPARPIPNLDLDPVLSRRIPVNGGVGCTAGPHISVAEQEARWHERNHCGGDKRRYLTDHGDVCWTWDCEAEYVSCHLQAGHSWPGSTEREFDIAKCNEKQSRFPATEHIWEFFDSLPDPGPATPP